MNIDTSLWKKTIKDIEQYVNEMCEDVINHLGIPKERLNDSHMMTISNIHNNKIKSNEQTQLV